MIASGNPARPAALVSAPAAGHRGWLILLGAGLLAGAFLRYYELSTQHLIEDEWHAVHKLLTADIPNILSHFGQADYSIPLTVYFRFLYEHGGLSENAMHLPMLLAGIALLAIAPVILRQRAALATRALWIALLAISPLLVYLTKTARPYALTSLLSFISITTFRHWWLSTERRRRWLLAYVASAALAGWLHPITLAFCGLPLVYYGAVPLRDLLSSPTRRAGLHALARLLLAGLMIAVFMVLAFLAPLLNDWQSLAAKAGVDQVTPVSLYRTLLMLYGISSPILLVALVAVSGWGCVQIWRREPDWMRYIAFIAIGGALAIAASRPAWIQHPGVLARYCVPILPLLLLVLAEGLVALFEAWLPARVRPLAALAAVAGLVALGPLPTYLDNPNQFIGHLRFQMDYDPRENPYITLPGAVAIPAFYRELGKLPPRSLTLIEMPWRLESAWDPLPWYQQVHRQYIKIGLVTPVCGVRTFGEYPETAVGLQFSQFVHLSALLRGETFGASFLVVHPKLWAIKPDAPAEWPDMSSCTPLIDAVWGPAIFRDEQIVVYSLAPKPGRISSDHDND